MQATIRLSISILGWMLLPKSGNTDLALDMLYARPYQNLRNKERAFCQGKPVQEAVAHVLEVCRNCNIAVSVCGNKATPTFRLWLPASVPPPDVIKVDLRYSLWSKEQGCWEERSPGTWDRMQQAFLGLACTVKIVTSPKKEIRYGTATISKGKAKGTFSTEWDAPEELAATLDTEDGQAFRECLPFSSITTEPGIDQDVVVKARTFRRLMAKIDQEEDNLMTRDKQEWDGLEEMFKKV